MVDNVEDATTFLQEQLVHMWQRAQRRKDRPAWWFLERSVKDTLPKEIAE